MVLEFMVTPVLRTQLSDKKSKSTIRAKNNDNLRPSHAERRLICRRVVAAICARRGNFEIFPPPFSLVGEPMAAYPFSSSRPTLHASDRI
jgi:hypothetical protein